MQGRSVTGVQEVLEMPVAALHAHEQRPAEGWEALLMRHKQQDVCEILALKQCSM